MKPSAVACEPRVNACSSPFGRQDTPPAGAEPQCGREAIRNNAMPHASTVSRSTG